MHGVGFAASMIIILCRLVADSLKLVLWNLVLKASRYPLKNLWELQTMMYALHNVEGSLEGGGSGE